jgi:hypothetical protein
MVSTLRKPGSALDAKARMVVAGLHYGIHICSGVAGDLSFRIVRFLEYC